MGEGASFNGCVCKKLGYTAKKGYADGCRIVVF